jgi:hypothetical protein
METSFGDISFEDDAVIPEQPAFTAASKPDLAASAPAFAGFTSPTPASEVPPATASVLVSKIATTAPPSSTVNLTEEELRAAITSASKEVIERIVWEVVPDLAEALIRDAIRKIKEGL